TDRQDRQREGEPNTNRGAPFALRDRCCVSQQSTSSLDGEEVGPGFSAVVTRRRERERSHLYVCGAPQCICMDERLSPSMSRTSLPYGRSSRPDRCRCWLDVDWKRPPLPLLYLAHQRCRGVNAGNQGRREERLFSSLCECVVCCATVHYSGDVKIVEMLRAA
ncbi:unnamed protein product, partial [Ectocarpus sp. 6 AP-2014]